VGNVVIEEVLVPFGAAADLHHARLYGAATGLHFILVLAVVECGDEFGKFDDLGGVGRADALLVLRHVVVEIIVERIEEQGRRIAQLEIHLQPEPDPVELDIIFRGLEIVHQGRAREGRVQIAGAERGDRGEGTVVTRVEGETEAAVCAEDVREGDTAGGVRALVVEVVVRGEAVGDFTTLAVEGALGPEIDLTADGVRIHIGSRRLDDFDRLDRVRRDLVDLEGAAGPARGGAGQQRAVDRHGIEVWVDAANRDAEVLGLIAHARDTGDFREHVGKIRIGNIAKGIG
jgi:hypothetical protein